MRRLSQKRRIWWLRKNAKCIRRRATRRTGGSTTKRPRSSPINVKLPRELSFLTCHADTVEFFKKLHDAIVRKWNNKIILDFSSLESINPSAALVLASELDLWRNVHRVKIRVLFEQWNEQPKKMLGELGLFDLLKVVNPPCIDSAGISKRLTIKFRTGAELINERPNNEQAIDLEDELVQVSGDFPGKDDIFSGITEAMNNVRSHAYPNSKNSTNSTNRMASYVHNRWWMTGSFNVDTRNLTIIFYDQGIGIPNAIEKKAGESYLLDFFKKFRIGDSDASRIQAAVAYGKTSTLQRERGKGLKDIQRVAETAGNAKLFIVSGKGFYSYLSNGKEDAINKPGFLNGTLIQWDISLPEPFED